MCGHPDLKLPGSAAGGMDKKRRHYIEGGQCGNREEQMSKLIQAMN